MGSGTIIESRGYIVTNDHVVTGAKCLQVELLDGTNLLAQVAGRDPLDDLTVMKITPPQHMALTQLFMRATLNVCHPVIGTLCSKKFGEAEVRHVYRNSLETERGEEE